MSKVTKIQIAKPNDTKADVYVVGCFERKAPNVAGLPKAIGRAAIRLAERKGFSGRLGQRTESRTSAPGTPTVVVQGLGSAKAFDRAKLVRHFRTALSRAARDGYRSALVQFPSHDVCRRESAVESAFRAVAASRYRFEEFRSKPDRTRPRPLARVRILGHPDDEALHVRARSTAMAVAEGMALTRDLANTPPNEATPEWMAESARALAESAGMSCRILGPEELDEQGMGGILAVGKGSRNAPRLAILEWGEGSSSVALVGKGVTFDTGGISIKPSAAMDEMKFDKTGACTVLGVAKAASLLELPYRFRAYLPLAENMPDGAAYRPGDVVRCYSGTTVEITNTDAEGRMLLADALALADEEGADVILDYATLTGACVVALGTDGAGIFSHDDDLAAELLAAADAAGEHLWRLPLWPEFSRAMKGRHADLRNTGGRWGGASTAAAFLANFVKNRAWAHLDIAGPAYVGRGKKGTFGATGYGVALTVRWLMDRAG